MAEFRPMMQKNPVSVLNEFVQKKKVPPVVETYESQDGMYVLSMRFTYDNVEFTSVGTAPNIKAARAKAASLMLENLPNQGEDQGNKPGIEPGMVQNPGPEPEGTAGPSVARNNEEFVDETGQMVDLTVGEKRVVNDHFVVARFNEFCLRNNILADYKVLSHQGPSHNPIFVMELTIAAHKLTAKAKGSNKKAIKKKLIQKMIIMLFRRNNAQTFAELDAAILSPGTSTVQAIDRPETSTNPVIEESKPEETGEEDTEIIEMAAEAVDTSPLSPVVPEVNE